MLLVMHMDRNSDHISANDRTNDSPMLIQQNRKSMLSHQLINCSFWSTKCIT